MAQRFNPAPGWPAAPEGWLPPVGWTPDPSWPPAPAGWQLVVDDEAGSVERFRRDVSDVLTREQLDERAAAKQEQRQVKEDARAARRLARAEAEEERDSDPTRGLRSGYSDFNSATGILGGEGRRAAERANRQLLLAKELVDQQRETNRLLGELLEEVRSRG